MALKWAWHHSHETRRAWDGSKGKASGAASEEKVWGAVEEKKGWSVKRGRVYTKDSTGQTRVYDGVAITPGNKAIGLEVKSGTSRKTRPQREYDARVNSGHSSAIGTGRHDRLEIYKSLEIRVPSEE